jgi:transcriptional regulator with XRE-family HTH domain
MAELARTLGVNPATITQVLKGKSDSARILEAARNLADELSKEATV